MASPVSLNSSNTVPASVNAAAAGSAGGTSPIQNPGSSIAPASSAVANQPSLLDRTWAKAKAVAAWVVDTVKSIFSTIVGFLKNLWPFGKTAAPASSQAAPAGSSQAPTSTTP